MPARPRRLSPAARLAVALTWLLVLLTGCGRQPDPPAELPGAASEPAGAVRQLADHLQRNDLAAFARDALPPSAHAALADAWSRDQSRWPLTELPLDDQLPGLLASFGEPGAEAALRKRFDGQLAGQDTALRDAARSLALFGGQYLRQQPQYSDEQRSHYLLAVDALGAWASQAPLGDRALGHAAIARLTAAAQTAGLASDADLGRAGMSESLRRLGPFLAALKATTAGYGLDLDRSLADLRTGLVEQEADRATVRLHYPLAAKEIDATVRLTRVDGHWYLDGYLEEAARLIAAATPLEALPEPPDPGDAVLPEPPPAASDPAGR